MSRKYLELAFTDSVKERQSHYGSRKSYAKIPPGESGRDFLTMVEVSFIAKRDGFYMATVSEDVWPYVQFRGGPQGFLKVLDGQTIAYADFRGNGQYISMGNLRKNDRVALFLMNYPNQRRLKIMATTEVFDAEDRPDLVAKLTDSDYSARVERVVLFHVVAYDWNCPQHITPRFTQEEWAKTQLEVDTA